MLATTAPRQGHFLSLLQPIPWQTPTATTSSTHDLHTPQTARGPTRERSRQHTTVTPPAPSRSMPAFTSIFSPQVDLTPPDATSASILTHDGSMPQPNAAARDSTHIATPDHPSTNTADSVQSSSDPVLLSAPLQREAIDGSLCQKITLAHPTSTCAQSGMDVASSSTRACLFVPLGSSSARVFFAFLHFLDSSSVRVFVHQPPFHRSILSLPRGCNLSHAGHRVRPGHSNCAMPSLAVRSSHPLVFSRSISLRYAPSLSPHLRL